VTAPRDAASPSHAPGSPPDDTPGRTACPALPVPVVLHLDTERGWRGGERQVLWLARMLDAGRYQSLIVARSGEPLAARARDAGIPVVETRPLVEFDPVAAWSLRQLIRRRTVRIVHAHTAHAVALAALATLQTSARLVVTRRVDFRLRSNPGSRWKYRRADGVIAISQAVADALIASGIIPSRIEVIPSGVDLARPTPPVARATLVTLGVPADAPVVVQVAQLVPHKDPVLFVDAIAVARRRIPTLHAVLVGDGPLRDAVHAAVARHGLGDVFHAVGYRTDADALLAAADVVTLSSREEGMGTVLLDALAFGKPVVATAAGGIPEIIEDGISGILTPVGDAPALGAAIAALFASPDRRAMLSSAARVRASLFSMAITAARTASVYDWVLGGGR
jgi:glycosyltransferase involved in cell wall biosynthesis